MSCSRLTEIVETRTFAWVLLYSDGETRAEISLGGRTRLGDMEFIRLLSMADEGSVLAEIS